MTGRPEHAPIVVDGTGVRRQLADGSHEAVSWHELKEVAIRTIPDAMWGEDAFFLLVGSQGDGCAVPSRHPAADDLMARLQELPGFDDKAFFEAMTSTEDSLFVCWQRPA
ncbi:MAG: hypothetical protein ACRDRN_24430 [Sciscionella sp.]